MPRHYGRLIYNVVGLRTLFACFLTLVMLIPMSACAFVGGANGGYHYKVIVEVETPEGIVTGSAVRAVSFFDGIRLPESGPSIRSKGEAVVIDLGKHGILFALMDADDYRGVFAAFGGPPGVTPEGIAYYESLTGQRASLPPEYYPRFVIFEDLNEPSSIIQIVSDQENFEKYRSLGYQRVMTMEQAFDAEVFLRKIVIEITEEPVTFSVYSILPWLPDFYDKRLDGHRFGTINAKNRVANSLTAGAFSEGGGKDAR